MKPSSIFLAAFVALPAYASAQPAPRARGFVSINLALEEGARTLAVAVPSEVFESSGTLAIDDSLGGGTAVDVGGGVRGPRFGLGVGYSRTRVEDSLALTASTIPASPGGFRRSVRGVTPELLHEERVFYLSAAAIKQVTRRLDVTISGGPAFFSVRQELPDGVTLTPPLGASIQHVSTRVVQKSTIGFHASLDLNWMIRPHIGVGGLGRYSWGSLDLPDSTGSMMVGGLAIGLGLRARF